MPISDHGYILDLLATRLTSGDYESATPEENVTLNQRTNLSEADSYVPKFLFSALARTKPEDGFDPFSAARPTGQPPYPRSRSRCLRR